MELYQDEFASPVGVMYVVSDRTSVRAVDFEGYEARMHRLLTRHYGKYTLHAARGTCGAVSRLTDYFAGDLRALDALPVATNGTPFQRQVWAALRAIPAGTTASYGMVADRIGRPTACRAVGLANGANPIGIVVPCHRVVGADAGLTGYGGGIERKRWLLVHEGVSISPGSTGQRPATMANPAPDRVGAPAPFPRKSRRDACGPGEGDAIPAKTAGDFDQIAASERGRVSRS